MYFTEFLNCFFAIQWRSLFNLHYTMYTRTYTRRTNCDLDRSDRFTLFKALKRLIILSIHFSHRTSDNRSITTAIFSRKCKNRTFLFPRVPKECKTALLLRKCVSCTCREIFGEKNQKIEIVEATAPFGYECRSWTDRLNVRQA